MIDILVESQAAEFIKDNRPLLRNSLQEKLNFGWESVFILDFIYHKKLEELKDNPEKFNQFLVLMCSYLGMCIYKAWEEALGSKPKLQVSEKPKTTISLKLDQGSFVAEEPVSIDLLASFLTAVNSPSFNYARKSELPFGLEKFKINYFAHGVLFGIHPEINGTWKDIDLVQLQVIFREILSELCEQLLVPLQLKNPEKTRYMNRGFYNPHLIFPPLGYDDNLLGLRPAYGIAQIAKQNNIPNEDLINLASVLLESPSILQAAIGFIILVVLKPREYKNILQEFALEFPILAYRLKPAVNLFAKEIKHEDDWTILSKQKDITKRTLAILRLESDIDFGLNPLFHCPDLSLVSNPRYRSYFENIDLFILDESFKKGNNFMNDGVPSIIIQQAYLAYHKGNFAEAKNILNNLSYPDLAQKELEFALFINASMLVATKQLDSKENLLNAVISAKTINPIKKKRLLLNYLSSMEDLNLDKIDLELVDDENISLKSLDFILQEAGNDFSLKTNFRNELRRLNWHSQNIFQKSLTF